METIVNRCAEFTVLDELVAGRDDALVHGQSGAPGGGNKLIAQRFIAGKLNQVHLADESDRVADGGGIHVMLDGRGCDDKVADGDAVCTGTRHAEVQNPAGLESGDHLLGAHGGIDLAWTAHGDHSILTEQFAAGERIHPDLRCLTRFHFFCKSLDLNGHGTD